MKVALCSDYFYPKIGGITTHIEYLARFLKERGHDVTIVTKKADFNDKELDLDVVRVSSLFRSANTLDIPYIDGTDLKAWRLRCHPLSPCLLSDLSFLPLNRERDRCEDLVN